MTTLTDTDAATLAELVAENLRLRRELAGDQVPGLPRATAYVWATVVLCALGVAAMTTIFVLRPDRDNTQLVGTVLGFLVPTVLAFGAMATHQVHAAVNSRLSQLVRMTAKASRAEGQLEGIAASPPAAVIVQQTAPVGRRASDTAVSSSQVTLVPMVPAAAPSPIPSPDLPKPPPVK